MKRVRIPFFSSGVSQIKTRAIKRSGRTGLNLAFLFTLALLSVGEPLYRVFPSKRFLEGRKREREKKGAKSGRAASRWRHNDRRRLLAGFVAIIQLVKVSGRVTAHKTNMIAAANCCEPRGSNKGGRRWAKGLVLSGTDEVITG